MHSVRATWKFRQRYFRFVRMFALREIQRTGELQTRTQIAMFDALS